MNLDNLAQSNREIFLAALDMTDGTARQALLEEACGEDVERRREIERLLAAHHTQAANPLDRAVERLGPTETRGSELYASAGVDISDHPMIDHYKLLEQIGEGGMGVVYVALQQHPIRRTVALKVIKPGMDSRQVISRFEAERQALAMMNHPHIAKVLDAGATESGSPYFVMELVKGIPITDFCDQHRLDLRQRLDLFLKVCEAVQHAHQKGIIHRDLKPTNILVELEDVRAVPKVIDFGVAKATHQALTERTLQTGFSQMIGTPLYMSPEQAQLNSLDVDTRSDIYSLGVLLYELLTGGTPFDHKALRQAGFDEMRRIIREDEPPRPSARVSTLNQKIASTVSDRRQTDMRHLSLALKRELDWIVMKTLEKDRTRRYDSASALAADLQRYLDDEPVTACPPSKSYRLKKVVRRNKSLLATTGLVVFGLLTGTLLASWQAVRATSAESRAARSLEEVDQQRKLAEKNFLVAQEAVERMLSGVAESPLAKAPELAGLRESLLHDALEFYNELIELVPNDSNTFVRRAMVKDALQQYDEALADFRRAVILAPNNHHAHARLASFLRVCQKTSLRDYQAAQEHAEEAVRLAPDNPWNWGILGTVYRQRGMFDETTDQQRMFALALSAYDKAIRLSANTESGRTVHEQSTRTHDAIRLVRQGSVLAATYSERSEVFHQLGDFERAIADSNKAIELDAGFADAYRILADHYRVQGKLEQAMRLYDKSLELDHYNLYTYTARAGILFELKRYEEALEGFGMSIRLAPQRSYHYKYRANTYFQLGEFSRALEDLATAVELNPSDTSNLTWTPIALVAACPVETYRQGLLKLADRTVELTSGSAPAHAVRGHLLFTLDERDRGRADLQKVTSSEDASCYTRYLNALLCVRIEDHEAYRETCSAMLRKYASTRDPSDASLAAWTIALAPRAVEDYAGAIALARLGVELKPNDRSAIRTLGAILLRSGIYEGARDQLTAAIEMQPSPSSSTAYEPYLLALTYYQLGQEIEARQWLERAQLQVEENAAWNQTVTSKILRAEAKKLIGSPVRSHTD